MVGWPERTVEPADVRVTGHGVGRRLWPAFVLREGVALVFAGVALGHHVDDRHLTLGGMDAAVVVAVMAVAAVLFVGCAIWWSVGSRPS